MMYAASIAPEDFSMSSVRAMIAASGGATLTMVTYENTKQHIKAYILYVALIGEINVKIRRHPRYRQQRD